MSETRTPDKVGKILKSLATHHDHGEGWTYSRDIGELEHIRFKRDHTGYNHWTKRLRRGLSPKHLLQRGSLSKRMREGVRKPLKDRLLMAWAWFYVSVRKNANLPDGRINGNITFWEEDGEYIEAVGPTVGSLVAEFLQSEPGNSHAVAISEEIERIWALSRGRREA